jgi:hypothetical protein
VSFTGDPSCAIGCGTGNATDIFSNLSTVSSQQLVKAITNPAAGVAATVGSPLGWYDRNYGEISDREFKLIHKWMIRSKLERHHHTFKAKPEMFFPFFSRFKKKKYIYIYIWLGDVFRSMQFKDRSRQRN